MMRTVNTQQKLCASPPVPDWAALAPARVSSPPVFRCKAARWLEMVEVHTLCFHIKSAFLYKSVGEYREQHLSLALQSSAESYEYLF